MQALGDEVEEVNAPLALTTAERVAILQRPWLLGTLAGRLLATWWHIGRDGRRAARARRTEVVIVGYLGHLDVLLARVAFPDATIVLDFLVSGADTARDRGIHSGARLRLLSGLDRLAGRCADVVVVDTPESTALVAPSQRGKVVVAPVGAGQRWFRAGDLRGPAGRNGGLRVVFFGLFTPLQGTVFIGEALGKLAENRDIEYTLIGTGQDWEMARRAAARNPRVTWLEWVDSDRLPEEVAEHDVCLGIFGVTSKAARVVPNKVYQGSAAGCAIVTSDTGPQRRALGDAAWFVPPGDAEGLASALRCLAAEPRRLKHLQDAARRRSREMFTPAAVVGELRTSLLDISGGDGRGST